MVIGAALSDLITIETVYIWGKLFLSQRLFILDDGLPVLVLKNFFYFFTLFSRKCFLSRLEDCIRKILLGFFMFITMYLIVKFYFRY